MQGFSPRRRPALLARRGPSPTAWSRCPSLLGTAIRSRCGVRWASSEGDLQRRPAAV